MRVAFVTNLTARDSLPVLDRLSSLQTIELVQVIFYDTVGEARQSPRKIIKEFGWRRVLSKMASMFSSKLRRLLLKGPLRNLIQPKTSLEFVLSRRLPYTIVKDLNHRDAQERLRGWNIDVLLVCICKNILNKLTLDVPRLAAINIHPSLLPKYRGPMPVFWMLYHGESQAGVTFQRMTPRIDDGPIVAQYSLRLDLDRTEEAISRDLFRLAAEKLDEVLIRVREGEFQQVAAGSKGSYHSYPTLEDQQQLKRIRHSRRR